MQFPAYKFKLIEDGAAIKPVWLDDSELDPESDFPEPNAAVVGEDVYCREHKLLARVAADLPAGVQDGGRGWIAYEVHVSPARLFIERHILSAEEIGDKPSASGLGGADLADYFRRIGQYWQEKRALGFLTDERELLAGVAQALLALEWDDDPPF